LELIGSRERIALYGGGKFTRLFVAYLEKKGLIDKVCAIVVSDLNGNPESIGGIRLQSFSDFIGSYDADELPFILVTLCGLYHKEIEETMLANGISEYELLDDMFLDGLDGGL
jgi:hypothetical protein